MSNLLPYLKQLESESVFIIREALSQFENTVVLYSAGKDSSVLLRLLCKAFHPGRILVPLMHVDTGWKFPEMYSFRENAVSEAGARLIVEKSKGTDGTTGGAIFRERDLCCHIHKTEGLLGALKKHGFKAAIAGGRRDEEKSRGKERIFSLRDGNGGWNPLDQGPEIWNFYNTSIGSGESVRVFPLSNWTELDIWKYIKHEEIPVVSLYFARERKVAEVSDIIIPIEYLPLLGAGRDHLETSVMKCRYRSLGCIPCTGAVRSEADTMERIIEELEDAEYSERENRAIDLTGESSMEEKKRRGYF